MYNLPDWKVEVIYNGVNVWHFDGWIDPGAVRQLYGMGPMDPMVLFVGRIVYQKGPDLLVEAIIEVMDKGKLKAIETASEQMLAATESE